MPSPLALRLVDGLGKTRHTIVVTGSAVSLSILYRHDYRHTPAYYISILPARHKHTSTLSPISDIWGPQAASALYGVGNQFVCPTYTDLSGSCPLGFVFVL